MLFRTISDWDDAYANGRNIAGGDRWPDAWTAPARAFRESLAARERTRLDVAYGPGPRHRLDLFLPASRAAGLLVFVHGGFWLSLDKSFWSHLAQGAVDSGLAVAIPSYTLCPDARIAGIVREVAGAIAHAASLVEGPITLAGHSAGGQLVTRMVSTSSPLPEPIRDRVRHVLSISGVHDLRPLMRTAMNDRLGLDEAEARAESPALLSPIEDVRVTCWVGGGERSEFIRQTALLANIWTGLGARTCDVVEPDRHHFNVIDGLCRADHPMVRTVLT